MAGHPESRMATGEVAGNHPSDRHRGDVEDHSDECDERGPLWRNTDREEGADERLANRVLAG